jgi:hypothetical protein
LTIDLTCSAEEDWRNSRALAVSARAVDICFRIGNMEPAIELGRRCIGANLWA